MREREPQAHIFISCMNYTSWLARVPTSLHTLFSFTTQRFVSFRLSVVTVFSASTTSSSSSIVVRPFLSLCLSLALFVWCVIFCCSFAMRPFFGKCFPSNSCTICLMTKWQLNVSRVDSVCFGVNCTVRYCCCCYCYCSIYIFRLDSHFLPGFVAVFHFIFVVEIYCFKLCMWMCVWYYIIDWMISSDDFW